MSLKEFRKDVILELYNEAGQMVIACKIYRCWPSEYQALPNLDANSNAIAIEHIKLENEGWERDASVTEPVETWSRASLFYMPCMVSVSLSCRLRDCLWAYMAASAERCSPSLVVPSSG